MLCDAGLFQKLEKQSSSLPEIIETCVRCKAEIVAEDEHDTGRRRLLNLGHTFGHAVESRSHFTLLHGEAVAIGMGMICRAAVKKAFLSKEDCERITALLEKTGLPTKSPYGPDELYETLLLDKKFSGGKLHLIVPRGIGRCDIVPVTPEDLREWLEMSYE